MDFKERIEQWGGFGALIVVAIAVIAGLFFKGFDGANLSDAVKDIGAALVPILTAYLAYRLVIREMPAAERFVRAGEEALREVQQNHRKSLWGPAANSEKYDPENPGKAGRFLFIRNDGRGDKGKFVPVLPLGEGILSIHVMPASTVILQHANKGEKERQAEAVDRIGKTVHSAVKSVLETRWPGTYELDEEVKGVAIFVDFDEARLGPRKFKKAVVECVEAAWKAVENTPRPS